MNAAYLLVTTAWLAGADPAPPAKPAPPQAAPYAAPAGHYGDAGCCGDNDCGCGGGWRDKLRGWFHRGGDCCENTCDSGGYGHKFGGLFHRGGDCCENTCDGGGYGHKFGGLFHRGGDCCENTCDSGGRSHYFGGLHQQGGCCADSCNECSWCDRLKGRLRGWFHRDDCCDSCGGCDGHGTAPPPRAAEPIPPPKELKKMPGTDKKSTQVLTPVPAVAPVSRVIIEQ